jgi:hypothetical protein
MESIQPQVVEWTNNMSTNMTILSHSWTQPPAPLMSPIQWQIYRQHDHTLVPPGALIVKPSEHPRTAFFRYLMVRNLIWEGALDLFQACLGYAKIQDYLYYFATILPETPYYPVGQGTISPTIIWVTDWIWHRLTC